ncbi:LiaF transmembrane domain-containing protein [Chryseolinea lacunae]|uniref:LiaF transmembrane domain-containing protein n=1 Tax=Chryseolinea lacunae TaxID=2801331 RepID=A0ABS1KLV6_9BACT|nr:DUF5668 domain-containing protein [Chryseolinea lacunae]MBL0740318.1 hypothetical protein [Chryseolinea lacunae]
METIDKNTGTPGNTTPTPPSQDWESGNNRGRIAGGIFVVGVGSVLLARQLGADIPEWVFSWPMIPIVIGLFVGIKHSFRQMGWLIPVAIGTFFLMKDFIGFDLLPFWPVIIIIVGLAIMIKPRRNRHWRHARHEERWKRRWESHHSSNTTSDGDHISSVSIFGGTKKNVISKDFKGGETVCLFGGLELNMIQADVTNRVKLDVVQLFGATKIVVPAHWKIVSDDLVTVFGSIEDKRVFQPGMVYDDAKVLVLEGTCVFGGIELRSY